MRLRRHLPWPLSRVAGRCVLLPLALLTVSGCSDEGLHDIDPPVDEASSLSTGAVPASRYQGDPDLAQTASGLVFRVDRNTGACRLVAADYAKLVTANVPRTIDYEGGTYTVDAIDDAALASAKTLTSVTLPEGLRAIGTAAFAHCARLLTIALPTTITRVGRSAFEGCAQLREMRLNVPVVPGACLKGCDALQDVRLGPLVCVIEAEALANCAALATLSVEATEPPLCHKSAFAGVDRGECQLTVPDEAAEAYRAAPVWRAFYGLDEEEDDGDGDDSEGPVVYEAARVTDRPGVAQARGVCYKLDETTHTCVATTGDYAALAQADIPGAITVEGTTYSVTGVADGSFASAAKLLRLDLREGAGGIGTGAFANCAKLAAVELPVTLTTLEAQAFSGCKTLTALTLPAGLTTVGGKVLSGCPMLTKLVSQAQRPPTCADDAFEGVDVSKVSLTVPDEARDAYCQAEGWRDFFGGAGTPADQSWREAQSLAGSSDVVAEKVVYRLDRQQRTATAVGYQPSTIETAFVPAVVVHEGRNYTVTGVADRAFAGAKKLSGVVIDSPDATLGAYAFEGCHALASLTLPSHLERLDAGALSGCDALATLTLPATINELSATALSGCSALSRLVCQASAPPAATAKTFDAFNVAAATLVVPNEAREEYARAEGWQEFFLTFVAGQLTFRRASPTASAVQCTGATAHIVGDVAIPATVGDERLSVEGVASLAFENQDKLTGITLPATVARLGAYVFEGCDLLTTIVCLGDVPPTVQGHSLARNLNVLAVTLTVPDGATEAYAATAPWASLLNQHLLADDGLCYELLDKQARELRLVSNPTVIYQGDLVVPATETIGGIDYTVVEIGPGAVSNYYTQRDPSLLTSLSLPATLRKIGERAFSGSLGMDFDGKLAIPDGVQEIAANAFRSCMGVTSITLGAGLRSVGDHAFDFGYAGDAFSLTVRASTPPSLGEEVFSWHPSKDVTCVVPAASLALYQASPWAQTTWGNGKKLLIADRLPR